MHIERGDGKLTLFFERSADQRAMASLHLLIMGGFVVGLLYGAVYGLLHAPLSHSIPVALFFAGAAAFATWNGSTSLLEPDYTTVFDLKARRVTLTESGLLTRQRGPVPFDEITGLDTRVGAAMGRRSVIAELVLAQGEQWRLGYQVIWVRKASSSDIPGVIAQLREATDLPGRDSD